MHGSMYACIYSPTYIPYKFRNGWISQQKKYVKNQHRKAMHLVRPSPNPNLCGHEVPTLPTSTHWLAETSLPPGEASVALDLRPLRFASQIRCWQCCQPPHLLVHLPGHHDDANPGCDQHHGLHATPGFQLEVVDGCTHFGEWVQP